MTTPVVFRTFKDGDVIALFPTLVDSNRPWLCESYMHVGQHSDADYDGVVETTKLSTPEEYADLLEELKSIGYDDLKIYKRWTRQIGG